MDKIDKPLETAQTQPGTQRASPPTELGIASGPRQASQDAADGPLKGSPASPAASLPDWRGRSTP
eukprot:3975671-Alexandrium_andersonii.AAC.1